MEPGPGEDNAPEFYAKLVRSVDGTANQGCLHFTSVPPAVRARLDQLRDEHETLMIDPC
ncbi:MAG: hypothetical protein KJ072_25365 [Verrucomicrobia bacterium]|nr:hypothetical protein [Verrucomicrobiota bacterium]